MDIQQKQTVWNFRLLIQQYAQFWFSKKKGLRLVSPPYFGHEFSKTKKNFLLYSINWPNFIVSCPLLLEISSSMCIAIAFYSVRDIINFRNLQLSSLPRRFPIWPKIQNKNLYYSKMKIAFEVIKKSISHHFQRIFSCQRSSQT